MDVWEVLSRRRPDEDWAPVGTLDAADLDMAMLLGREVFFRHGEGREYAVRARGSGEIHPCPDPTGIGGVIDRAYRRQDGYVGVGAKLKRVQQQMAARGLVIEGPRPGVRGRAGSEVTGG